MSLHLPNFIPFSDESDDPAVLLYLCAVLIRKNTRQSVYKQENIQNRWTKVPCGCYHKAQEYPSEKLWYHQALQTQPRHAMDRVLSKLIKMTYSWKPFVNKAAVNVANKCFTSHSLQKTTVTKLVQRNNGDNRTQK